MLNMEGAVLSKQHKEVALDMSIQEKPYPPQEEVHENFSDGGVGVGIKKPTFFKERHWWRGGNLQNKLVLEG